MLGFIPKPLNQYIYIWAINSQSKPCIHIYVYHIYVFSLHSAVSIHFIICIYMLGHVASCHPTSLLPPMRRFALDSMQKNRPESQYKVDQALQHDLDKFLCMVLGVIDYIYWNISV